MDEQQQWQINEAAEKFANTLKEAYRAVADRVVSTQQLNTELMQSFFNDVVDNLGAQVKSNQEITQELINQQVHRQEATQALVQDSTAAYM